MPENYKIIHVNGHYDVYIDGEFYCSADTVPEAAKEIERRYKMNSKESLAIEIYNWCKQHHLWGDNIIYFDGKAWAAFDWWNGTLGKKIDDDLYEYENKNPLDYFEYANPETLSMSFEGPLYHVLNGYVKGWTKLEAQLQKLFEKHGYYYEMGHAWNLSAYEV